MNDSWYSYNSTDDVVDDFSKASQLLEQKVEIANKQCLKRAMGKLLFEFLVVAVFVGIAYVGYINA